MRQVVLLRGINLGPHNRIAMPKLREALDRARFATNISTYVQSGNILLDSDLRAADLADAVWTVLAALGIAVPLVIRTREELAQTVAGNPFPQEAERDPKSLQVTFRWQPADADRLAELEATARAGERLVASPSARELYTWHPAGVGGSKLALALNRRGEPTTTRNWRTVATLLELAGNAPS